MNVLTVKDLLEYCKIAIKEGHGNDKIMISQDDEGNGYHYLFFSFTKASDILTDDEIDTDIAPLDKTIILG